MSTTTETVLGGLFAALFAVGLVLLYITRE
jgi:hypothetical protein